MLTKEGGDGGRERGGEGGCGLMAKFPFGSIKPFGLRRGFRGSTRPNSPPRSVGSPGAENAACDVDVNGVLFLGDIPNLESANMSRAAAVRAAART